MNIFIKGDAIETALYIGQKSVELGKRTALVTGDASMLPFNVGFLNRKTIDFKGMDIYADSKDFIEKDYGFVIYYNCSREQEPSNNDICLWVVMQGALSGQDPFAEYRCRKRMVVRDYIPHPMSDAILQNYMDYDIYRVPYTEDDQMENVNIKLLGAWDFSKLSESYKDFLTGFCKNKAKQRMSTV